jgi:hypothetical protein
MTTLTTAPLAPLLDRLYSEAEAPPSGEVKAALSEISPEQRASLSESASATDYRRFYTLARDAYLAVSRDTAQLPRRQDHHDRVRAIEGGAGA